MRATKDKIDSQINQFSDEIHSKYGKDYVRIAQTLILFISNKIEEIKEQFEHFENIPPDDEIFYFKNLKAPLIGLIIYYRMIQNTELSKPAATLDKVKKHYLSSLQKLKKNTLKNNFINNYYKSNSSQFDIVFFNRLNFDIFNTFDNEIYYIDGETQTPMLYSYAKMIAYEHFNNYLKDKIKSIDKIGSQIQSPLSWSYSKTDLIELIYALHSMEAFNNGKVDLKNIIEIFENVCNFELNNHNRIFVDIKARKKNKVKFLELLIKSLHKKIDDDENEYYNKFR